MELTKDVPCKRCKEEKRKLEEVGVWEVISCEPIPNKDGWCRIKYRRKTK